MSYIILPNIDPGSTKFNWGEAPGRSWYHENVTGSDKLLVTVGDSWSWGDSLGTINLENGIIDDHEHRTTHVFGALLAKKLGYDFLMLAKCGATNGEIHNFAFNYIDDLKKKYKKIVVIITLTELARELTGDPWWLDPLPSRQSLDQFLSDYERNMLTTFRNAMAEHPEVEWFWARNFTSTYPSNFDSCPGRVADTWVEILSRAQPDIPGYPENVRIVSQLGFVPIEEYLLEQSLHRSWRRGLYEIMASASLAIDWLDDSKLNNKKATKHPTEQGHQLWADYLYEVIRSRSQHL